METNPATEMFCSLVLEYRMMGKVRNKTVILSVIHHHDSPLEFNVFHYPGLQRRTSTSVPVARGEYHVRKIPASYSECPGFKSWSKDNLT
jgi:hypothetical protein